MKSAEQLARECLNTPHLNGGYNTEVVRCTHIIRQAQAEAYEAGQRDMREAACNTAKTWHIPAKGGLTALEETIRALPIKPMQAD